MTEIRAMISTKPYSKHVVGPYFTIDTNQPDAFDLEQVNKSNKNILINSCFFFCLDRPIKTIHRRNSFR